MPKSAREEVHINLAHPEHARAMDVNVAYEATVVVARAARDLTRPG